ncbi:MAG: ABC transporter permease [Bacteroidetes bacterium]|nr:ABC transporter permease [Bacteroidota bacterium]MBU2506634.1 ABC transporter permease [Bacteroidota bacterium]
MLIKIAWRNIWRNKRRSIIVLSSVIVGIVAAICMDALQNGMLYQMLFNQINLSTSHIQIHKNGFIDNKIVQNTIPDNNAAEQAAIENEHVSFYSKRVITFGLISSANNSSGIFLFGVDPELEKNVSIIISSVVKGKYFETGIREVLIGTTLSEKLQVDIGDKIVCMANMKDGSIGSDVFRVIGIFRSPDSEYNKAYIYVPITDAQNMLELGAEYHELAIITKDYHFAPQAADEIESKLGERFEVLSYDEVLPLLVMQLDMYKEMIYVINFIIGLALIFGIINAMLMAVYERTQEIGVLMAIGMKNGKIVNMIVLEAFLIGLLGTIIGVVLGWVLYKGVLINGIDLSSFAESLDSFGIGAILYPKLSMENLISLLLTIPLISIIGAFYPAYRAVKLQPVTAIRHV